MKSIALLILVAPLFAANPTVEIKVDQVGYLPNASKIALVVSKNPATEFTVNQSRDGKVVFRGNLSASRDDYDSGDRVQAADFTRLAKTGQFYVDVPGVGRSWDFDVTPEVYDKTWRTAMRSYYGQRCGIAVDLGPEFPGYKHAACHLEGAYHPSSGKTGPKPSAGGWHDAGDYGRYIVNSGISTGTLLWAYEFYGGRLRNVNLAIPESGNGQPDMLNEIQWNLKWMLSMQDSDGGVWQKQTSEKFCDFIMPEKDKLVSYVIGTGSEPFKSSCAAGDFAAVMAIAGRVYRPFNPAFAEKCSKAAQNAFAWLEKHTNVPFKNPPGVSTGEYGDRNCADEQLWAAAELFRTTGDKTYSQYFVDRYAAFRRPAVGEEDEPPSWSNVGSLALWTYAMAQNADPGAANSIRHDLIAAADEIANRANNGGYRISLVTRDYVWGSNGILANYGMELMVASSLLHNDRYAQAALEDLHYILGRNTFSLSFVTRVGENPFRHPHHRPSAADGKDEPWPGLMSGGPNKGRQDDVMRKVSPDLAPAKTYLDDQGAYSANEVAINWNAPLVFLLAGAEEMGDGVPARGGPTGRGRHQR
ncbi:MAG TPA: glycoside hydrolase family 9 protein [Bryobacteraceae bacterium]|jgi:endoglucanase|nr:glycoside hydrolase family 9 protein [Bryobacteraceae bacterium]